MNNLKYEYGVDYETNGEKPELPDDVLVHVMFDGQWTDVGGEFNRVECWGWKHSEKFRIVDERYKATDHVVEVHEEADSNWYERGELPPVGTQCEVNHIGEWKPTVIVGYDGGLPVFKTEWNDQYAYACGDDFEFRSIRTDRDVLADKAADAMRGTEVNLTGSHLQVLSRQLIDANWRPVKQQSEVEFISQCVDIRERGSTSLYRSLYLAGCRFIEVSDE